jgi:broad specificity phosphatase PhoE
VRLRRGPAALWLVRHGESEGNLLREEAYRESLHEIALTTRDADSPLSPRGEEQARAFGRWLAAQPENLRPTAVLASPYLRARETARLALEAAGEPLRGLEVDVDERLRDREMGLLDGLTWRGIVAKYPEEAERKRRLGKFYHRPPGGESWADICLRLRTWYADVARDLPEERILVVAHDAVIHLTRVIVEGLSEEAAVRISDETPYLNAALTAYEREPGGYRLTAYNEVVGDVPR